MPKPNSSLRGPKITHYWFQNIFGSKILGLKMFFGVKILFSKNEYFCPNFFEVSKITGSKQFFGLKKVSGQKIFGVRIFSGPKNCFVLKILGPKIFWAKKIFRLEKFFWTLRLQSPPLLLVSCHPKCLSLKAS